MFRQISQRDSSGSYVPRIIPKQEIIASPKDRVRTLGVAIVTCLNLAVEPPDLNPNSSDPNERPQRTFAWIPVDSLAYDRSLQLIGQRLQEQYEVWQPKAKYKQCLDPFASDLQKSLSVLRRYVKNERILFHWHGHGVPRPSANGELWVFNRAYTQYIPVSMFDVQSWIGGPSILVLDCSGGGVIIDKYKEWAAECEKIKAEKQKEVTGSAQPEHSANLNGSPANENNSNGSNSGLSIISSITSTPNISAENQQPPTSPDSTLAVQPEHFRDSFILSATNSTNSLPTHPALPTDLFTACLTTPLTVALRFFCYSSSICKPSFDFIDRIPGDPHDRKTPLGELNWIFTAITDAIAFGCCDSITFQRLFRNDLLVASLFRNFLLADRILRSLHRPPVSYPALPLTHKHPLWSAWDAVCETFLLQLEKSITRGTKFMHSNFFNDQMQSFETWLDINQSSTIIPQALPVLLQLLLSPAHRRRALNLLSRFVGKGTWAIQATLCLGIAPYVLKLLQSPAIEHRDALVFIWSRIIMTDVSNVKDLSKQNCVSYFLTYLASSEGTDKLKCCALYTLASVMSENPAGQNAVLSVPNSLSILSNCFESDSSLLRMWTCVTLAKLWNGCEDARQSAFGLSLNERLSAIVLDDIPEVRAAAIHAISTLFGTLSKVDTPTPLPSGSPSPVPSVTKTVQHSPSDSMKSSRSISSPPPMTELSQSGRFPTPESSVNRNVASLSLCVLICPLIYDASVLVREELCLCLQSYIESDFYSFVQLSMERDARESKKEEKKEIMIPPLPPLTPTWSAGALSVHSEHSGSRTNLSHSIGVESRSSSPSASPFPSPYLSARGAATPSHYNLRSSSPSMTDPTSTLSLPPSSSFTSQPQSNSYMDPTTHLHKSSMNVTVTPALIRAATDPHLIQLSAPKPGHIVSLSPTTHAKMYNTPPSPLFTGIPTPRTTATPPFTPTRARLATDRSLTSLDQRQLIWKSLRVLCQDAFPTVAQMAVSIYKRITSDPSATPLQKSLFESPKPQGFNRLTPSVPELSLLARAHDTNDLRDDREGVSRPPGPPVGLRRIASASSHMHSHHHHSQSISFFPPSSAVHHLPTHLEEKESHPSPFSSKTASPLVIPGHTNVTSLPAQSMLGLLSKPLSSSMFARGVDQLFAPNDTTMTSLEELVKSETRERRQLTIRSDAYRIPKGPYDVPTQGQWDQLFHLPSNFPSISSILFHPYEPILAVADHTRSMAIFDLQSGSTISTWSNGNRTGTRLSCLQWINETDVSLLAAGSDGGVIRIWRNPHVSNGAELVTAWKASKVHLRHKLSPLVMDWKQQSGYLTVSGSSDFISIWDLEKERKVIDLPVIDDAHGAAISTNTPLNVVNSICCSVNGIIVCGTNDGTVRMWDIRESVNTSCTVLSRHQSPVIRVQMQHPDDDISTGYLFSANEDGDILRSDLRFFSSQSATVPNYRASSIPHPHSSTHSSYSSDSQPSPLPLSLNSPRNGGGPSPLSPISRFSAFESSNNISMSACALHSFSPLMASASRPSPQNPLSILRIADWSNQNTLFTFKGRKDRFSRSTAPIMPWTSINFHPYKLQCAAGNTSGEVFVFGSSAS